MTYNSGTATDYIDLLDQLIEVMTGRHMATMAVNAGGTGHAVGDIITIDNTGATQTETALIEVLTLSGSAIATARIYRGGVYTVDPTTIVANAQSATTGSGTGATFDITFDDTGWTQLARQSVATTAVVAVGGTGYTNGSTDVLTLVGGVLAVGGSAATYTATVAGGIVTSVALIDGGDYEVLPTNAVLTSVSPTGGTGCTLNVTWADKTGDTMVVLQGDAGSSTAPLIGIKTFQLLDETNLNTTYNWGLFSFTAWSATAAMHEQANVCRGFNTIGDGTLTTSDHDGSFVPLRDFDATYPISWWISANGRRVTLVARTEDAINADYSQLSFGLLNPYGITTEMPYPAYVAGSSDRKQVWFGDQTSAYGGLSDALMISNSTSGPAQVWAPEGEWLPMRCGSLAAEGSTSATYSVGNTAPRTTVWPLGTPNAAAAILQQWNIASSLGFDQADLTLATSAIEIYRTPDTGGDLFPLYPITYQQADSASGFFRTFGEVDGVFFIHNGGAGISSEDRITQGGVAYTIFQNGTRTGPFSFMALRED